MSKKLSWRQCSALVVLSAHCLLFCGVVFGWPSLAIMLTHQEAYSCHSDGPCESQVIKLSLIYTISQFVAVAWSLPVGFVLDHTGADVTNAVGCVMIAVGVYLLSSFGITSNEDSLLPAMILISAGGPSIFFSALRRAEAFPGWESQIITLVNSLFDASACVFAFLLIIYEAGIPWTTIFWWYGSIALLGIPANVFVNLGARPPSKSTPTAEPGGPELQIDDPLSKPNEADAAVPVSVAPTLVAALSTRPFAALLVFASVHVLRSNCYLGTVGDALAYRGDDGGRMLRVLAFMLPLGLVATPAVGRLIDRVGPWPSLFATNVVGALHGAASIFLPLPLQPITFLLYVLYRTMLYSSLASAVAVIFGYERLGRILGVLFTCAAFCTLLQYPLVAWTIRINAGNYFWAYTVLWIIQLPLFAIGAPALARLSSANVEPPSREGALQMPVDQISTEHEDQFTSLHLSRTL